MPRPPFHRRIRAAALAGVGVLVALSAAAVSAPASAHGFSSVVYADVSGHHGSVDVTLQLEYDLLVVSTADAQGDDPLFREGSAALLDGDDEQQAAVLDAHAASVDAYVTARFTATADGGGCPLTRIGAASMTTQQDVPYAVLTFTAACERRSDAHVVSSRLFADDEGYVRDTKTILTYDIDGHSGSAALDAQQPSFSTGQSVLERFWEFFHLGAEHLLTGIDHICFLLVLIVGSRRLREVVLAATAFTVAHSVTFILASTGVISLPPEIVEPTIALSITVVAGWYVWRLWRKGKGADELDRARGPFGLDRAGWFRLAAVFVFGLVHGMGFASALGIDEPWSWTLLWSLLVFNLGIEAVQLVFILVLFPLLVVLRHRAPRVAMWTTGILSGLVALVGLVWFLQRILQI